MNFKKFNVSMKNLMWIKQTNKLYYRNFVMPFWKEAILSEKKNTTSWWSLWWDLMKGDQYSPYVHRESWLDLYFYCVQVKDLSEIGKNTYSCMQIQTSKQSFNSFEYIYLNILSYVYTRNIWSKKTGFLHINIPVQDVEKRHETFLTCMRRFVFLNLTTYNLSSITLIV